MEKQIFNPWNYQEKFGYAQAVEVKNVTSTLYCAGQAAINADGHPSADDMEGQLVQALENLEMVVSNAGYQCQDIVRLDIFTTSATDFFNSFQVFTDWISEHGVKEAMTLLEVKGLAFDTLKIELEATVVK